MSKQDGLSDTKKLPQIPDEQPNGRAQAPHTSIRRASMMGGDSSKRMPVRQAPERNTPERRGAGKTKPQKPPKVRRQKKHGAVFYIIISLLALVLVLFGAYSAVAVIAANKIRSADPAERKLDAEAPEADPKVRNTLVITTDTKGDADSFLMLSISRHNHTIVSAAIQPECYVSIPGAGTGQLRTAYSIGGGQLTADTVVNNFDIAVDDFAEITPMAMIRLTDALGGVQAALSDKEAAAVNQILESELNQFAGDPKDADYLPGAGTYRLNGKQALGYMQLPRAVPSQNDRTQTVQNALLDRAKQLPIGAIPEILRNVCPEITTNLSGGAIYLAALKAPYLLLRYDRQELTMPVSGSCSEQKTQDGTEVLSVDFGKNLEAFQAAVGATD